MFPHVENVRSELALEAWTQKNFLTILARRNDGMALPNINNGNPLRHNDDLCRHPIVILLEVVNDAAP